MTLYIKSYQSDISDQWDQFVIEQGAPVYLLTGWKTIIEKSFGHRCYYFYIVDAKNQWLGVLPLVQQKSALFGNYLTSVPFFNYGGVWAKTPEAEQMLLQKAVELQQSLNAKHVELRQIQCSNNNPLLKQDKCRTDKITMLLELPEEPEMLWKAIGSKRRAQIKRPIREGAHFKIGKLELLHDFYSVFARNMRDLGTPVYDKRFFRNILEQFPEETSIAMAYVKDQPAGAGFLIDHQGIREIPWASTVRDYNRIGINMYLYWNILSHSIESGLNTFDFGRSSKDAGTLKFKKQWGAQPTQLYWYYLLNDNQALPQLNHSNRKYQMMIQAWQKLPLSVANIIGPHIVKHLP